MFSRTSLLVTVISSHHLHYFVFILSLRSSQMGHVQSCIKALLLYISTLWARFGCITAQVWSAGSAGITQGACTGALRRAGLLQHRHVAKGTAAEQGPGCGSPDWRAAHAIPGEGTHNVTVRNGAALCNLTVCAKPRKITGRDMQMRDKATDAGYIFSIKSAR